MIANKIAGENMKTFFFTLAILFISSLANASKLEDVSVLEVMPEQDNVRLRLQAKDGPPNSYFYVDITKNDPEAFDKLVKVVKKAKQKRLYQLDLDILSFSISPSGSYYKSESVGFDLQSGRAPNSIKSKKKK